MHVSTRRVVDAFGHAFKQQLAEAQLDALRGLVSSSLHSVKFCGRAALCVRHRVLRCLEDCEDRCELCRPESGDEVEHEDEKDDEVAALERLRDVALARFEDAQQLKFKEQRTSRIVDQILRRGFREHAPRTGPPLPPGGPLGLAAASLSATLLYVLPLTIAILGSLGLLAVVIYMGYRMKRDERVRTELKALWRGIEGLARPHDAHAGVLRSAGHLLRALAVLARDRAEDGGLEEGDTPILRGAAEALGEAGALYGECGAAGEAAGVSVPPKQYERLMAAALSAAPPPPPPRGRSFAERVAAAAAQGGSLRGGMAGAPLDDEDEEEEQEEEEEEEEEGDDEVEAAAVLMRARPLEPLRPALRRRRQL
eukprot:tig00021222_g19362.t1